MKTYQYSDPMIEEGDIDDATRWIAARTRAKADAFAKRQGWHACGGEIFDERKTAELLAHPERGGIDVVLP